MCAERVGTRNNKDTRSCVLAQPPHSMYDLPHTWLANKLNDNARNTANKSNNIAASICIAIQDEYKKHSVLPSPRRSLPVT